MRAQKTQFIILNTQTECCLCTHKQSAVCEKAATIIIETFKNIYFLPTNFLEPLRLLLDYSYDGEQMCLPR